MSFPSSFDEIAQHDEFSIHNPNVVVDMSAEELSDQIEDLIQAGVDLCRENRADATINVIYSTISNLQHVSSENQALFVDYMLDISRRMITLLPSVTCNSTKSAYKKVLYLFQYLCSTAEQSLKLSSAGGAVVSSSSAATPAKSKSSKKGTLKPTCFSWMEWRHASLEVLLQLVASDLGSCWSMGIVDENFLSHCWNYPLKLLIDRPTGVGGTSHKDIATRALCVQVVSGAVRHFGSAQSSSSYETFSAALMDSIVQVEHMGASIAAEICSQCCDGSSTAVEGGKHMVADIIAVISRMSYSQMPASGIRNVAAFIESFAKTSPSTLAESFPLLLNQLDAPVHQIRSAILLAGGSIIVHIHETITSLSTSFNTVDEAAIDNSSDDRMKNTGSLGRFRDSLLDVLMERIHDMNPYTRTTVLKVWSRLVEAGALPIKHAGSAAEIALDRLFDKNAGARRNAVCLMTACIDNNPFSGTLDRKLFQLQTTEVEKSYRHRLLELRALHPHHHHHHDHSASKAMKSVVETTTALEQVVEVDDDGDDNDHDDDVPSNIPTVTTASDSLMDEFEQSPEVLEDNVIIDCKTKLSYLQSVVRFVTSIEGAVSKIGSMLQSKTNGDVVEALRFFTRAISFQISGALNHFKQAFSLIWHQDVSIKSEMLSAFHNIYLTDGATDHPQFLSSHEIVSNLVRLVRTCDSSQMTSMEKIVAELFANRQVGDDVCDTLWRRISEVTCSTGVVDTQQTYVESQQQQQHISELGACFSIIAMIAQSAPDSLTTSRVTTVVRVGLSEQLLRGRDYSALKAAAKCLQMTPSLLRQCSSAAERDAYQCSPLLSAIVTATPVLVAIMVGSSCGDDEHLTRRWFSLCEEAIHAVFHIHPVPDKVMTLVIQHMYGALSSSAIATPSLTGRTDYDETCSNICSIARLLFVLGQTCLSSLVYTETIAATAKKYPSTSCSSSKGDPTGGGRESKTRGAAKTSSSSSSPSSSGEGTGFMENVEAVDAMEEEMGAAAADDADREKMLNDIIEQQLVVKNLLGKFLPLVTYLVADEQALYGHALLRESSTVAMCRYMSTSSSVCESLLPLLFTVLEKEASPHVRTSIVIALGDLAFRFPNSVEPWTNRIYYRLSDPHVTVRYNTLMVVTHLVLNDMIKVKGQVSHVANSLNDDCEHIRELAKLFFVKLSERSNNPVYNLLGDIISIFSQDTTTTTTTTSSSPSSLSSSSSGDDKDNTTASVHSSSISIHLSKEQFETTMHFLLSFVQKDKQADTLLERLLTRLGSSNSALQRRNLAFCISELTVTEKGVKKMIDMIKTIKDALYDSQVYECFQVTLSRCKKLARAAVGVAGMHQENKSAVEEFELLMTQIHAQSQGIVEEGSSVGLDLSSRDLANAVDDDGDDGYEAHKPVVLLPQNSKAKSTAASAKTGAPRSKKSAATSGKMKKKESKSKRTKKAMPSSDDDEEGDEDSPPEGGSEDDSCDEGDENKQRGNRRAAAGSKQRVLKATTASSSRRARKVLVDDDDEEEEEEDCII